MRLTATKLMLIKHIIANGTENDLIKEVGVSWYVEPPLIDEIKAIEEADKNFFKAVNEVFQLIFLSKDELYMVSQMLQVYALRHPVRQHLLSLAAKRKLMETPVVVIDFNAITSELFQDGSAFIQAGMHGIKHISREEVIKPIEFPHQP
ncbi:hypothetical protein I6L27_01875 [Acinetobacter pittii]|uniref:hypothetical protein n=1 Tax=Acinetobacter pittii TaxID=48296 RepID=UPI001C22C290|nr:hypothetical protein [Acinetobacter pittii]QXA07960.1 hypothetical protein I6L27_19225 [Acinetobacter pittii]QXA08314.1 hypothetical protein I6L27_01875 [Acinetobacter pittii]